MTDIIEKVKREISGLNERINQIDEEITGLNSEAEGLERKKAAWKRIEQEYEELMDEIDSITMPDITRKSNGGKHRYKRGAITEAIIEILSGDDVSCMSSRGLLEAVRAKGFDIPERCHITPYVVNAIRKGAVGHSSGWYWST